jgi:dCTP deaminase
VALAGPQQTDRENIPPGILVDHHIVRAREQNLLSIDPFELRCLEPATYDVRVGDAAAVSTASRPIDLRHQELLTIEPGAMAILQSLEVLKLSKQIVGRLGPKTSLLRRGIVAATGPQIDPGFHGRLIVNLINLSPRTFVLRHADPFISVEFHRLAAEPDHGYRGEYQDRMGLAPEELEILFAYQGPTLAEIYRGFSELRDNIRDIARLRRDFERLDEHITGGMELLQKTVSSIPERQDAVPLALTITNFPDESYVAIQPIPVLVRKEGDSFLASFFDANVHASGETDQEALDNLRSSILDTLEVLSESEGQLALPAERQWRSLKLYVRRTT